MTAAWSWTAANDRIVEVRGARQRSSSDREAFAFTTIESGASPDDPAGNNGAYWDNASGLHWHGSDLPLGPGSLEFPRDQANAAFTWLVNRHELEGGADWQDIGWEALNRPPPRYFGSGYDPSAVGGFARPEFKRVFIPVESPVGTRSTHVAVFAQDRVDLGERWAFSLGLRLEDQAHEDDRGREVIASTDLVPRAAMVYDVGGRGKLLIKATAGRYVTQIPTRLPEPGVLQSAQRRQRLRRVSLELGDAALRSLQPPPAPRSARHRRGRRALRQGRGDRRDRLAVDPGSGRSMPG